MDLVAKDVFFPLFEMFDKEYEFCCKERKRYECFNSKSIYYDDDEQYRDVFILIPKQYFLLKNIPMILYLILSIEGYDYCIKSKNINKTVYNNLEILKYSLILFVVFYFFKFNELKTTNIILED